MRLVLGEPCAQRETSYHRDNRNQDGELPKHVTLPPASILEFRFELTKGLVYGQDRRNVLFRFSRAHALELSDGLLAVQTVEVIGRVLIVEAFEDFDAARVVLGPFGQIVPFLVNANLHRDCLKDSDPTATLDNRSLIVLQSIGCY
eukprot:TRINITY_DN10171_c0_g1_i2.p2 TRINITY_DN10171_c0_g1~~TRINITY_DN10171_c0_g1_i2.p2  ORF type:complete len:146 (-),score=11.15 TRINITY_DN10171_c0_g1_i2:1072-1509(-)